MKIVLSFLLWLSISTMAYGAVKEATWTEFKPVKPPEGIISSGSINLGYQSVENVLGEVKQGATTKSAINFKRMASKGIGIDGNIKADKYELIAGKKENYRISIGIKEGIWEVSLAGDLMDSLNLVDEVKHQSKADSIKAGLKLNFENFPIILNYSRSSNKNREEVPSTQEVENEKMGLLIGGKFGWVQTNLNLNMEETKNLLQSSLTTNKELGLVSTIPLGKILQLNFGIQPFETETVPEDESLKVISKGINYTTGLSAQFSDKLRLITNFGLNNTLYELQDTQTKADIFTQNYGLFYQPLDLHSINITYNISEIKDANKSHIASANINYSPKKKKFFGQTKLKYQITRIEDNGGEIQSEGAAGNLNIIFNLIKAMSLSANFTNSTQKTYSIEGRMSLNAGNDLDLKLSHMPFRDLSYNFGYGLNKQEMNGDSGDITNTYRGDINYNLRTGKRELPISLTQIFTHSRIGEEVMDTNLTNTNIRVPITKVISISYSYGINRAKTEKEGEITSTETTSNTMGLELGMGFLGLHAEFNLIHSQDSDTQNINASLLYSVPGGLSFNINFIQNPTGPETTTAPSNLSAGLNYTF